VAGTGSDDDGSHWVPRRLAVKRRIAVLGLGDSRWPRVCRLHRSRELRGTAKLARTNRTPAMDSRHSLLHRLLGHRLPSRFHLHRLPVLILTVLPARARSHSSQIGSLVSRCNGFGGPHQHDDMLSDGLHGLLSALHVDECFLPYPRDWSQHYPSISLELPLAHRHTAADRTGNRVLA
jgi:hypothetical protein